MLCLRRIGVRRDELKVLTWIAGLKPDLERAQQPCDPVGPQSLARRLCGRGYRQDGPHDRDGEDQAMSCSKH